MLQFVDLTFGPGLCDAIACAVALLAAHDLKDFLAQAGPLDEVHALPTDARTQVTHQLVHLTHQRCFESNDDAAYTLVYRHIVPFIHKPPAAHLMRTALTFAADRASGFRSLGGRAGVRLATPTPASPNRLS
jgi:hypothetical protein